MFSEECKCVEELQMTVGWDFWAHGSRFGVPIAITK